MCHSHAVSEFWPPSPAAETWIRRTRWVALPLATLQGVLAWMQTPEVDLRAVLATGAVLVVLEGAEIAFVRRTGRHLLSAGGKAAVDIFYLALCSWFMRAAGLPGFDLLAVLTVPIALTLRPLAHWVATGMLLVIHNTATLSLAGPLVDGKLLAPHWLSLRACLSFDVAIIALTLFASHLRRVLEERQARLQRALEDHGRNERLVSLGVLAAGLAHELGTPLSSIDLLAGEAIAEPEEAPELLNTLRGQVRRCREILDRLRGTTSHTVSEEVEGFGSELRRWVIDWQGAGLDRSELALELPPELDALGVQGDAASWRGIVWSLLDNAHRAGSPLVIRAVLKEQWLDLEVDDSGPGPAPEVVAMAGSPFFTSWQDSARGGRGLGLFVARSFAARWGGNVTLSRRKPSGARVTIRFATLASASG